MNGERGAGSQLALDRDTPAVTLDHVLHDGQPQACPSCGPGAGAVHPVEALEYSIQVTGGDPLSAVAYPKHRVVAYNLQLGANRSPRRCVPDRVVEEIPDGDGHITAASRHLRRGHLESDVDSALFCHGPHPLQLLLD